jgi:hypothetical protein
VGAGSGRADDADRTARPGEGRPEEGLLGIGRLGAGWPSFESERFGRKGVGNKWI